MRLQVMALMSAVCVLGLAHAQSAGYAAIKATPLYPTAEQQTNKPSDTVVEEIAEQRTAFETADEHGRKQGMSVLFLSGFEKVDKDFAFLDGVYVRVPKRGKKPHPELDIRTQHYRNGNVWLYYNTETDAWLLGPELGESTAFAVGLNHSPNPFDVAHDRWMVAQKKKRMGSSGSWKAVKGCRFLKECDNHRECPRRPPKHKMHRVVEMGLYFCAKAKYLEGVGITDHAEVERIAGKGIHNMCLNCDMCLTIAPDARAKFGHPSVDGECPDYCTPGVLHRHLEKVEL